MSLWHNEYTTCKYTYSNTYGMENANSRQILTQTEQMNSNMTNGRYDYLIDT